MPNPKGNPESLEPYKLTTDRPEPLTRQIAVRVTESTYQQLQALGTDKAEFCRNAIQKALEERESTT